MYRCQSVLKEHQPPHFSVQDVNTVCEDAINETVCRYNCNGILQDEPYTLREQEVRLYEYSPTTQYLPTIYKCKTPIKYILRAHGVMLVREAKVILSDDEENKFTLFTYTNQGECLPAEQREFDMGCDDSMRDPLHTFSTEFYEVGFSNEVEASGINTGMGLVECSGNSQNLRNISVLFLIAGYRANQPNYRDMINYYTLNISITLLLFIAILFLISLIGLHKFYIKNVTSKLKSQFHIRYKSLKIVPIFSNLNGENDEN